LGGQGLCAEQTAADSAAAAAQPEASGHSALPILEWHGISSSSAQAQQLLLWHDAWFWRSGASQKSSPVVPVGPVSSLGGVRSSSRGHIYQGRKGAP
jgi:hypothetical protein